MNARNTQIVERLIMRKLVESLVAAGFVVRKVWDGGAYVDTPDADKVIDAVEATCEPATIHFGPSDLADDWGGHGVLIVQGNGKDCISDYHCRDTKFGAAIDAVCDWVENEV